MNTPHFPCIDPEQDIYIVEEMSGAFTTCECADCREARLNDDERIFYTAHEMADTWTDGFLRGSTSTVQRLRDTLQHWLDTDESDG
jgi:hypothetical protein